MTTPRSAAIALALMTLLAACGGSSTSACESTDTTGPCTGTFVCGNSGITGACDRALEICVIQPGQVNCVAVPGASGSSCPSEADAAMVAGCTTPFVASCSGDSSDGITVTCSQ